MNVTIDSHTERRLWALIRAVDTEIGGWGYAYLEDQDNMLWNDVFLVPQYASPSEVDFESTGGDVVAIEKAIADGVLDDPNFLWVSWHSHHTMKPYWSKTDDQRIEGLAKAGITRLLSFVGCHDGSYKMRLDFYNAMAHGVRIGQVTIDNMVLYPDPNDEFAAGIFREVAANVQAPPKPAPATNYGKSGPGYKSQNKPKSQQSFDQQARKPEGVKQLPPPKKEDDGGDRTLTVEEAFVAKDLMDAGFTYAEALNELEDWGVDELKELIDSGQMFGPADLLPLPTDDELEGVMG